MRVCFSIHLALFQVLYKHKIIVFGGFYDTLREVRFVDGFLVNTIRGPILL